MTPRKVYSVETRAQIATSVRRAYAEGRLTPFYKGKSMPPEVRDKISRSRRGHPAWNKGLKGAGKGRQLPKGRIPWNKGKRYTHDRNSEAYKNLSSNAYQVGLCNRGIQRSPTYRKILSAAVARLWKNPEYVRKQMLARNVRPTKPELALLYILDQYFPNEWEYTGNGKVVIDGLVPDFTNVNGAKAVIELFGDYWHSDKVVRKEHQTETGRIARYARMGFKCFVVWEREVYTLTEQAIAERISQLRR